jgi:carboxylate-amine ligase
MLASPTIGVEEEFLLIDPVSRLPVPAADRVVARATETLGDLVSGEFAQQQVEVKTPPCSDVSRLYSELVRLRAGVARAAADEGLSVCASGAPILADTDRLTIGDHPRYRAGLEQYRAMMDDFTVCAMHVHVGVVDRELAVLAGNHLRPWLPLLVALSANSPFQDGRDTGYADWRAAIRSRFPCLGPPPYAESLRQHEALAAAVAATGAMLDADTPFWDVRPNPRVPTLEVRAMDVMADVDDTVAMTVLIRALVATATERAERGDPGPQISPEVLRAAYWRAARDGWSGGGRDALSGQIHSTHTQARRLVQYVRAALEHHGDYPIVASFLERMATSGGGAERQRVCFARHGKLTEVVDELTLAAPQK